MLTSIAVLVNALLQRTLPSPSHLLNRFSCIYQTIYITNFFMLVPIGLLQPRPSLHDSNWSDLARYFRKYVYSSWWLTTFIFAGVVCFLFRRYLTSPYWTWSSIMPSKIVLLLFDIFNESVSFVADSMKTRNIAKLTGRPSTSLTNRSQTMRARLTCLDALWTPWKPRDNVTKPTSTDSNKTSTNLES